MADSKTSSLAVVFPGQGSQRVGMLSEFADAPAFRETFAIVNDALGLDLQHLVAQGPEAELNQTINAQPALLAVSVGLWRCWLARGGSADYMAGHSLGEYSALVAADALDLADAARLVRRRGELMQQAVPAGQGAMAAVLGLDDDTVEKCCAEAVRSVAGVAAGANFNAPGQVVIAGNVKTLDFAIELCRAAGAKKIISLPVSIPSHCGLMQAAADTFALDLADTALAIPAIPVIHNFDAGISLDTDAIRRRLLSQLVAPVRWTHCVLALRDAGSTKLLECGPGNTLTALTKRIDRTLPAASLGGEEKFIAALQQETDHQESQNV